MKISFMYGITLKNWLSALKINRYAVSPSCIHWALSITLFSFMNSIFRRKEEKKYGTAIRNTRIEKPPIFILGHWRSGTTHLHNILDQDEQFSSINIYQAIFPHTFLTTEKVAKKVVEKLIPTNRPQDNMAIDWDAPQEDEIAMGSLTVRSPALSYTFCLNDEYFNRYISFHDVSQQEKKEWGETFMFLMKKLTYKYKKAIVLKSPTNTARIKMLLEMFPEAKFIHIVRNPYKVYQSSMHLLKTMERDYIELQKTKNRKHHERILNMYYLIYNTYLDQVDLIPKDQFQMIQYEELCKRPIEIIESIYRNLNIDGISEFKPVIENYLNSLSEYKTNSYDPIPDYIKKDIDVKWEKFFTLWGYKQKWP